MSNKFPHDPSKIHYLKCTHVQDPPIVINDREKLVNISNQLTLRRIIFTYARNPHQGIKIEPATVDGYSAASK